MSAHRSSWIQPFGSVASPTLRVFAIPYAGAGPAVYRTWHQRVRPDVEVLPVALPGRAARFAEPALSSATAVVDGLAAAVAPYTHEPYAIFGHSMGALIGFELVHALWQQGMPLPVHLWIAGCNPPTRPRLREQVRHLSDRELIAALRRFAGTPPELLDNAPLMELVLPMLRADFTLCETYVMPSGRPRLPCPATVFGGSRDADVPFARLDEWSEQFEQPARIERVEGDHFFVHTAERELIATMGLASTEGRVVYA